MKEHAEGSCKTSGDNYVVQKNSMEEKCLTLCTDVLYFDEREITFGKIFLYANCADNKLNPSYQTKFLLNSDNAIQIFWCSMSDLYFM